MSILDTAVPFSAHLLSQPEDELQRLATALKFRHSLADEFSVHLKRNAGKSQSISWEMLCSPSTVATLFGWPGLPAPLRKLKAAGHHRISHVVTQTVVRMPQLRKELLILTVDGPAPLLGFLGKHISIYMSIYIALSLSLHSPAALPLAGRTFGYYPIVDLHHRGGGFQNQNYVCVEDAGDTISFSYDLTTHTLFVKARVHKIHRLPAEAQAPTTGLSPPGKKTRL
jgi:hypothetical protein